MATQFPASPTPPAGIYACHWSPVTSSLVCECSSAAPIDSFITSFDRPYEVGMFLCLVNCLGSSEVRWDSFDNFPPSLLNYLRSTGAFSPGSSTVPEWDDIHKLSFVHNYVRLVKDPLLRQSQPMYILADAEVQSWPFAVWSGAVSRSSSAVLVFGKWLTSDVLRVQQHYSSQRRWQRLAACPEWIYHDLNIILSDWVGIWNAAAWELKDRSIEVNKENFTGNVLQRMRRLNRAMATNILLRESLLIQQNSLKEIIYLAPERYLEFRCLEQDAAEVGFISRCNQMDKALSHDLLVVQGILEQLQNLMAMIVSVEQISIGQSVARLTYMGFVFLPVSLVAAIFSITTISPRWYPVGAVSALLVTIMITLIIPRIMSAWHNRPKGLRGYESQAKSPGSVEEEERGRSPIRVTAVPLLMKGGRVPSSKRSEMIYHRRQGSEPSSVRTRASGVRANEISAPMIAENSLGWN
ncbi:hypothetical protein B0O99DRAFT_694995 [Bisporella sp. PMI_857]|nr:hypothetical protein B0O99DRAFT_694995 [Bisporella sp. PMI_857]